MKRFIAGTLCTALLLTGCDTGTSSQLGEGIGDGIGEGIDKAVTYVLIGATVIGVAVYSAHHKSHEETFPPGLNLTGKKDVKVGKPFEVRAVLADARGKKRGDAWQTSRATWTIAPGGGSGTGISADTVRAPDKGEWTARFHVDAPGAYRVTMREWPADANPEADTPRLMGTLDVTAR